MKIGENKKLVILGVILLFIAGIIIVALKGFNVSMMFAKHESIDLVIGKEFDINDIDAICKEIFGNKKYELRKIELFNDAININSISISDDEKQNIIAKINEKYDLNYVSDDVKVNNISNIRIRDLIMIYIKPVIISSIIIAIYICVRYRKLGIIKALFKIFSSIVLTELVLISVIAIIRIPISPVLINILLMIAILQLFICFNITENDYIKFKQNNEE